MGGKKHFSQNGHMRFFVIRGQSLFTCSSLGPVSQHTRPRPKGTDTRTILACINNCFRNQLKRLDVQKVKNLYNSSITLF